MPTRVTVHDPWLRRSERSAILAWNAPRACHARWMRVRHGLRERNWPDVSFHSTLYAVETPKEMVMNRTSLSSFALLVIGGSIMLLGCIAESKEPSPTDEDESEGSAIVSEEKDEAYPQAEPQTNQAGQCCWGHCNSSNAFVKVNVTQNCRDRIIESCHNAGQLFNPNGDAWWGTCP
jgi:hypothetical protein